MIKDYLLSTDRSLTKAVAALGACAKLMDKSKSSITYDSDSGVYSVDIKYGDSPLFVDQDLLVAIRTCLTYFMVTHKDRFNVYEGDEKTLLVRLKFFEQLSK